MAKVRHDEIIPECNIDTNLVETLLKMINFPIDTPLFYRH